MVGWRSLFSAVRCRSAGGGWGKATTHGVLGDRARQQKKQEVIVTSGLAADARHLESAKRLAADQGAGNAAVEIKIAHQQLAACPFEMRRAARKNPARQCVLRAVKDVEC